MTLDREIYRRRLETMREKLKGIPADGLYSTPSSNLFYLTGIDFHRSERLTALLMFKDRDPVVLCPAFEESRLRGMSAVGDVLTWEETEDPFAKAASLFPTSAGTLAIEPSTAYDDVERLLARRPAWKPISAGALFGATRMIKTPEEIEAIRRAIAVALPRFRRAFAAIRPGATEAEISALVGGENVVQFGPSSALPTAPPPSALSHRTRPFSSTRGTSPRATTTTSRDRRGSASLPTSIGRSGTSFSKRRARP